MKKFFKIFIPLVILSVVLYQWRNIIFARLVPLVENFIVELGFKSAPCENPIPYTLDTFDTRFDISKSYFLDALEEAEKIWEKPLSQELFTYQEDGSKDDTLKINLIYDYRQEATSKLASLGIVVKDNEDSYNTLKIKFTELKAEFETAKKSYNAQVENYNEKQAAFEKEVKYWNDRGGAPKKEYEALEAEKTVLNREASKLQSLQMEINEMAAEINALVVVLNRLARSLNISVEKYNTIDASLGESFEEGIYQSDGNSAKINIYEFSNREKLVRILAHEFGHALELPHVNDSKAIMYEFNQGKSVTLAAIDLEMLKEKCRE